MSDVCVACDLLHAIQENSLGESLNSESYSRDFIGNFDLRKSTVRQQVSVLPVLEWYS
jgi:hypothetical protein